MDARNWRASDNSLLRIHVCGADVLSGKRESELGDAGGVRLDRIRTRAGLRGGDVVAVLHESVYRVEVSGSGHRIRQTSTLSLALHE